MDKVNILKIMRSLQSCDQDRIEANVLDSENLRIKINEEKALFRAAISGDYKVVSELLSLGVSVDAENVNRRLNYINGKDLMIPLLAASENGHIMCVQKLIQHGVNVNSADKSNCTALHLAAKNGHNLCLIVLLKAGAKTNTPICGTKSSDDLSPVAGTTALHLAAQYNQVKCVEDLINYGADYNAIDKNGHTSLYIAAKKGFETCVLTHLKHARGRDILSLPSFDTSDTPLHFAVLNDMVQSAKELVRLGSDVCHFNKNNYTPLHLLCINAYNDVEAKLKILKHFIFEGYNTDINISRSGYTPLYCAVFLNYSSKMIAALIAYGANFDITEKKTHQTVMEKVLAYISRTEFNTLKCLVKCMPKVPHLKTFDIDLKKGVSAENAIWQGSVLPDNLEFSLLEYRGEIYLEMRKCQAPLIDRVSRIPVMLDRDIPEHNIFRYRMQQPLLDLVFNRVTDEICSIESSRSHEQNVQQRDSFLYVTHYLYEARLWTLKKLLWYERMACTPRTLQDYCRICIRKSLCFSSMKLVRDLPLPQKLQSFLLFEFRE